MSCLTPYFVSRSSPLAMAVLVATAVVVLFGLDGARAESAALRPNILWLTCEDIGPHLGCYGDTYADTPNLDELAARGTVYRRAWSNAPVCAPARTTIITGVYPPSTGSQHMRSLVDKPAWMKMYPELLREAGYYCTNNSKTDYNLTTGGPVWDESSGKAHWKNRPEGKPFFAIFNYGVTHESQIRRRPHKAVHDPAKAPVPAYHPDVPEVRQDWAQYYDNITTMDDEAGRQLAELEKAGLADDTIVFFYGDHGSGMPRSKRWPYNSGLQVPMIVYIPEKFRQLAPDDYRRGAKSDRLVGFVDLAPTVLSLAGVKPPDWMQGGAFLGKYAVPPSPFLYGFRGRMDERFDMVRTVTDGRYVYIRNYMPHLIYGQYVQYMFVTPTTRVWREQFDAGKLNAAQSRFWQTKPPEELYDLERDPDEVDNLAGSSEHEAVLKRLRQAQQDWCQSIRDLGFLPEPEITSRAEGTTPYEMGHDPAKYPLEEIMATAELAAGLEPEALPELVRALGQSDSAVRYWGVLGISMRGAPAVRECRQGLLPLLDDPAPAVQIAAAATLGVHGSPNDAGRALAVLLDYANFEQHNVHLALMALNGIDAMDARAAGAVEQIEKLPTRLSGDERRRAYGIPALKKKILADLAE